jgi:hypothetical protein
MTEDRKRKATGEKSGDPEDRGLRIALGKGRFTPVE